MGITSSTSNTNPISDETHTRQVKLKYRSFVNRSRCNNWFEETRNGHSRSRPPSCWSPALLYSEFWIPITFQFFAQFIFLSLIGFNAVPGLSTLDYITVAVIEKYLDFKVRKDLIVLNRSRGLAARWPLATYICLCATRKCWCLHQTHMLVALDLKGLEVMGSQPQPWPVTVLASNWQLIYRVK